MSQQNQNKLVKPSGDLWQPPGINPQEALYESLQPAEEKAEQEPGNPGNLKLGEDLQIRVTMMLGQQSDQRGLMVELGEHRVFLDTVRARRLAEILLESSAQVDLNAAWIASLRTVVPPLSQESLAAFLQGAREVRDRFDREQAEQQP